MCSNLPPGVSWFDLEPIEHCAACDELAEQAKQLDEDPICICADVAEIQEWHEAEGAADWRHDHGRL